MTKNVEHWTEQQKQTQPLPGEVDPKDAARVAAFFALQIENRLNGVRREKPEKS